MRNWIGEGKKEGSKEGRTERASWESSASGRGEEEGLNPE